MVTAKYGCSREKINQIQMSRNLRNLPHPSETWALRDTDLESVHMGQLVEDEIVHRVGERKTETNTIDLYRTDELTYEILQDKMEANKGPLPCCDESWINNERGVDGITCGACRTVHDRSDIVL